MSKNIQQSELHSRQIYENENDNSQILMQCYEIITVQKQHIQKLQKHSRQVGCKCKTKRRDDQSYVQEMEIQMKKIISQYEQITCENQELRVLTEAQNSTISSLQYRIQQLIENAKQSEHTIQQIKKAYEVKIEKISQSVRQQVLRQIIQKQNKIRQSRAKASVRVHNFINQQTPLKRNAHTNFKQSERTSLTNDSMQRMTRNNKTDACKENSNLCNAAYLASSSKKKRGISSIKLFNQYEQRFKTHSSSDQNPELFQSKDSFPVEKQRKQTQKVHVKHFLHLLQQKLQTYQHDNEIDD